MKINLKQLFSIVGESRDIAYTISTDELSDIRGRSFASPVEVKGRIYNRAGVVYLEYSVDMTLLITCDRCLKELERAYHYDFDHIVVPSANSDNDEYIVADGESIELNEIAVTDLLLQLPTKNLCKDDCKGLCMICGCDLNESTCDHLNQNEL
ncbi:MAG: DUF177 domain-containing protein [Ruminococcus sp.]|jgi:uncharacterized protein|nr:DUF177 domain-containing protein [Ruminococcus sp.]MCR5074803.1 DUF177 domain-containing protein [Ruminococcus sp.]